MKKYRKFGILIISLMITGLFASSCLAANSLVDTQGHGYADGGYTLNDIREYAIYIMKLILGLVGGLSLLAFVYGGVNFLISAGNPEKVKDGINTIKAAVIGLLITFASVLIINVFFGGLGVKWEPSSGEVGQTPTSTLKKLK